MTSVKAWHDGSGFGADWHLDSVTVENQAAGCTWEAAFNAWIKVRLASRRERRQPSKEAVWLCWTAARWEREQGLRRVQCNGVELCSSGRRASCACMCRMQGGDNNAVTKPTALRKGNAEDAEKACDAVGRAAIRARTAARTAPTTR